MKMPSSLYLASNLFIFFKSAPLSDIGIGQSQDDSIVGLRQTKHIPAALPVSGTLSSSNPDLLQSHHRILDFSTTPGEHRPEPFCFLSDLSVKGSRDTVCMFGLAWMVSLTKSQNEPQTPNIGTSSCCILKIILVQLNLFCI